MHISRVELENIKNYESVEYFFEPGITAISGPNGAGKTTIIEAIAYTLFDHLPFNKEHFLKRGTKKGSVRVTFVSVVDGREYAVYRDTASGYYIYDPITKMRLVEQKGQVINWIREHLGVDAGADLKTLFISTIGVPQGTFTVGFAEQPAKRKVEFDKVLRVEEYQRASEQVRSVLKILEIKDDELREEIARLSGEIIKLDGLMAECHRQENTVKQLQGQIAEAETQQANVRAELLHSDSLKKSLEDLNSEVATLSFLTQELNKRQRKLDEEVALSKRAREAVMAAAEGYAFYNQANSMLNDLQPRVLERNNLRDELQKREQVIVKTETLLQSKREDLAQIAAAREEAEKLEPLIQEQLSLEKQVSDLQRRLTEFELLSKQTLQGDRELQALRKEYQELSRKVQELESLKDFVERLPELEQEREHCEITLRQSQVKLERLSLKKQEVLRSKENMAKLKAEIKTLEAELLHIPALEKIAKGLPQFEETDLQLSEAATELRLKIQREEQIIGGIRDGLCPLLSQRCLNIGPERGLDSYFQIQIGNEREQLALLEQERAGNTHKLIEARNASQKLSGLNAQLVHLQRRKQEYELEERNVNRLQNEIQELSSVETQVQVASQQFSQLLQELKQAQNARVKYESIEPLRSRLPKLKAEGQEKRDALSELKKKLQEKETVDKELAELQEKLAALADPRSRYLALEREFKKEEGILAVIADMTEKERGLLAARDKLVRELEEFSMLDEQLFRLSEQRGASAKDYHTYVENQSVAAMLEARELELNGVENELKINTEKLNKLNEVISKILLEYDEQAHARQKVRLEELIGKLASLSSELNLSQKRVDELQLEISELLDARNRLLEFMQEKEKSEQIQAATDFIRDLLKKAGPFITEAHLQSISMEANQLYRDVTGNPLVSLRWDTGYEILVEEGGHERPFASLSGGEKMSAALSVRLALLKELSDIRVAFFDEPTANMDEERRRNLAQQIGRIKDFNQLFVVSHDDTFEGFTDRVVSVQSEKNDSV